jgi:hypothetical protein
LATELLALPVTKTSPSPLTAAPKGRSNPTALPAVIGPSPKLTALAGSPPSSLVTLSLPQLASQMFPPWSATVPCGQLIPPTS